MIMNRVIKFRGKRADNGEWVFGSLLCDSDGQPKEIWGYNERLLTYCGVIPETVGQFTGLLDKNGKEIYEHDVVSDSSETYEVRFGTIVDDLEQYEFTGFYLFSHKYNEGGGFGSDSIQLVVKGNIYETPNLLQL